MTTLLALLDIDSVFFTILGYPMSYLEFFGTIFTIWCVWLTAKARVLSWPVGIIGSLLYLALFYQIQLYSDLVEQAYFIVTGFVGWLMWTKTSASSPDASIVPVNWSTERENAAYAAIVVLGTLAMTYAISHLHVWLPAQFPEPASFPLLDSFTTVMSLMAQWLLIRRRIESWILWIAVDAIAIWLYWVKDVKFISLEYLLFLGIAIAGLIGWMRRDTGRITSNLHV